MLTKVAAESSVIWPVCFKGGQDGDRLFTSFDFKVFIHHFRHAYCVIKKVSQHLENTMETALVRHESTLDLAIYLFTLILLVSKKNEELCN